MDSSVRVATLLQTVKYMNVCSITILIYDWLLTLDMEVEYVWKAQRGVGKVLFLLERYLGFIDVPLMIYYSLASDPSNEMCKSLFSVACCSIVFGVCISEAILVLRTYALWAKSRRILFFLLTLYVCFVVTAFVILAISLGSIEYGSPPPWVKGCYAINGRKDIIFIDFLLLSIFEIIIMILTIWIGLECYRHSRNPLIDTLYRDGILYFVWIFLITLGNTIVFEAGPNELIDLLISFQAVMHSSLSTRILLHVRSTVDSSINNPRSLPVITDIQLRPLGSPLFHGAPVSDDSQNEWTYSAGYMSNATTIVGTEKHERYTFTKESLASMPPPYQGPTALSSKPTHSISPTPVLFMPVRHSMSHS